MAARALGCGLLALALGCTPPEKTDPGTDGGSSAPGSSGAVEPGTIDPSITSTDGYTYSHWYSYSSYFCYTYWYSYSYSYSYWYDSGPWDSADAPLDTGLPVGDTADAVHSGD